MNMTENRNIHTIGLLLVGALLIAGSAVFLSGFFPKGPVPFWDAVFHFAFGGIATAWSALYLFRRFRRLLRIRKILRRMDEAYPLPRSR